MVITNDIDSILMPPPPPRLPKRQRLESSALDPAAGAGVSAVTTSSLPSKGQSSSHDSVFSHHHRRHQNSITVDTFHINSGGANERNRSVSPDEIDVKIISGVGNNNGGGGGNNNLSLAASNVEGVEKRLEGTFDDLVTSTNASTLGEMHDNNNHEEFQPSSQNYDPTAVSECGEGKDDLEEESTINDFATKTDKSHISTQGEYEQPPIPNASFRDIIGHGQAKLRLDEALLPLALPPDLCDSVLSGIRAAPASILLHGPPGCGKTKLAKAVAGEAQAAFLSVGPSDILSKFVGESESAIRGLFREGECATLLIIAFLPC